MQLLFLYLTIYSQTGLNKAGYKAGSMKQYI